MNIVLGSCAVAITVVFIFLSLEAIDTLRQIKKTATEAEKLLINANNRLSDVEPAFRAFSSLTSTIVSGWGRVLTFISSFLGK